MRLSTVSPVPALAVLVISTLPVAADAQQSGSS